MSKDDPITTHHMGVIATELEIEALSAGGRGVGRAEGKAWFVARGVPGDLVRARPWRQRPQFVEAERVELIRPSPARREPACRYQESCGGCPWMVLDEAEQRRWKRRLVVDALERIGGLRGVDVGETLACPQPLGYRNKVEFHAAPSGAGSWTLGLFSADPRPRLIDVERCAVLHDAANELLPSVREWLRAGRARSAFRLVVRRSWTTGELLVAGPAEEEFAAFVMERHPEIRGVVQLIAPPGRRGGVRTVRVRGRDWIEERIGGASFHVPASSFLQVNGPMAEPLLARLLELAGDVAGAELLDLYGGIGVSGLALAARGARVTVCEADAEAVRCGREAARRAGRELRFVRSDVARFLRAGAPAPAVAVANPPRGGMGRQGVEALVARRPGRIVVVSCDPATLARDLRQLVEQGYRLGPVLPVDLFPQTAHVETLVALSCG